MLLFNTILGCVSTDIVDGTCFAWTASGYAIPLTVLIVTYLMPLTVMLLCYTRIVYKVRRKVTSTLLLITVEKIPLPTLG